MARVVAAALGVSEESVEAVTPADYRADHNALPDYKEFAAVAG